MTEKTVSLPVPGQEPWGDQLNTAIETLDARVTALEEGVPPVGPSAPANTALPAITGATTLGAVLTCSMGTWTNSPTGYTYQWQREGTAIAGATASTHTIVAADQGTTLTCTVTATNAGGADAATTAGTAIPAAANAPANTALPVITGTPSVGATLTCSDGMWTNSPTGYAYQWKRNGTAVPGGTAATHLVAADDLGYTLTCTVTATNASGSGGATAAGLLIPNPNRQVFVMMGQSNMVGRGTGSGTPVTAPGKAYTYNHQTGVMISGVSEPIVGADPNATSTNNCAVSWLVKSYTDQLPSAVPVVNKSCQGNTSITAYNPGAPLYLLTVNSTNACKALITSQGNTITDVWGFWLQGESDAVGAMSTGEYKTKLADLFERLKVDVGLTRLFILRVAYNKLNASLDVPTQNIMKAQKQLSSERSDVVMLSNIAAEFATTAVGDFTGPTMNPSDGIHYTTYGYSLVGEEAAESLLHYVTTGAKPPLVENVPALEGAEQHPTMVENRWDFTKGLTDEVGDKDFVAVGTGHTLDATGLRIPAAAAATTTISLATALVLDDAKDWAVEYEVTLDTVASITSSVGTVIGNRTGGIKDNIWFGIGGTNTLSVADTAGVYQPSLPITVPTASTRYKLVFVASTGLLQLVVNDVLNPTSVPHSGNVALRYLLCGYDATSTYVFKGVLRTLSVRYDVNPDYELPAVEPTVLADFTFNETGIINNAPAANTLIVMAGREAGHTFSPAGITLLGGTHSGFTLQTSILLNLTSKWVVAYHASWFENSTGMGTGYSASDGMLLADNTTYDWCYGGSFRMSLGGVVAMTRPYFNGVVSYVISYDPARGANPARIELDGVLKWQGAWTVSWGIKRFGGGYTAAPSKGWPGTVEDFYIAINTTEVPSRLRGTASEARQRAFMESLEVAR